MTSRCIRIVLVVGVLMAIFVEEIEDFLDGMLEAVGDWSGKL